MEGKRMILGALEERVMKSGEGATMRPRGPKENVTHSTVFSKVSSAP